VAVFARVVARSLPAASLPAASRAAPPAPPAGAAPRRFVLAAAAIVGFAFLLMELVWYRALAPILGGSSYTFGLILALALLGVGIGGAGYAARRDRPATLAALALTCALEALFLAIPYALGDRLALVALAARQLSALGFGGIVLGWSLVAAVVVVPAAIVSGYQFPLLIALLGRGARGVGADVGLAYAWNTAGAIAGSLAGGFGVMPLLGAMGAWRAVVVVLAALGAAAAALGAGRAWPRLVAPVAIAAASLFLLRAPGPTAVWRHAGIGAGRAQVQLGRTSTNLLEEWKRAQRRFIAWEAEGVESSVALSAGEGDAFVVNGKIDGHATVDAGTQVMSGLLGALVHPEAHRALVVGLGTGSTAGWLGVVPTMERVDVVELEPAVKRVARDCALANQAVLDNPKVHVVTGDAREVLLTTRARYDLIFSEPSNPYRAGIASLFTREFYAAAAARLSSGGVFLQWLQAYEVDAQTVRTAIATLASVLPEVSIWVTEGGDLVLFATREPLALDVPRTRARLATEPYRTAAAKAWRVSTLEGVIAHHAAAPALAREIARQEGDALNTDDLNLLEWGFARGMGREAAFTDIDVWATARARKEDRPAVVGGPIDWASVDEERRASDALWNRAPRAGAEGADAIRRAEAYAAYVNRDPGAVVAAWAMQPRPPEGPFELSMIGEALAETGAEAAVAVLDRLRPHQPTEADAHLARLRLRQGRLPEAVAALEAALLGYRRDPWPRHEVMRKAIAETALAVSVGAPSARRIHAALREPFALHGVDDDRLETLLRLSPHVDLRATCLEAVTNLEPHFPFRADLLRLRKQCYEAVGSPRLKAADADLDAFVREESLPFSTGLL
jgi:spermidine synthase